MKTMLTISAAVALTVSVTQAADWPHWGNGTGRNMVNTTEKNMPTEWDVKSNKNIKWVAKLGTKSYGNTVVADGRVYVGTNNEGKYDPAIKGDKGNILAFSEKDGKFLWQAVHDKLKSGRVNDWPEQGICSTVWVDGKRVYYLNNRCQMVCADAEGFYDKENDGIQTEQYKGDDKADIIWMYDVIEELGAFPHNLATSSPLLYDGVIYVMTANGVDEGHLTVPMPTAPSTVAIKADTGELLWEFAVHDQILHGQWSSLAAGEVKGVPQIIVPGGDGWVYSLHPKTGEEFWRFNLNPPGSVYELGGYGTKNYINATPVFLNNRVYIAVGQDPEHGTGIGHLYAIDATGKGDVTKTHKVWHLGNEDFGRTLSTVAVADGLLYTADLAGIFFCLDAATGKVLWTHDLEAAVWGSPTLIDGKVYIGDEAGDVTIFAHGKEKKIINTVRMDESVLTTPVAANGVLYVATKTHLYAISAGK